jgi:hypothetical protein
MNKIYVRQYGCPPCTHLKKYLEDTKDIKKKEYQILVVEFTDNLPTSLRTVPTLIDVNGTHYNGLQNIINYLTENTGTDDTNKQ